MMLEITVDDVNGWVEGLAVAIRSIGNGNSACEGGADRGGLEVLGMALAGPGVGGHSSMAREISDGLGDVAREIGRVADALGRIADGLDPNKKANRR